MVETRNRRRTRSDLSSSEAGRGEEDGLGDAAVTTERSTTQDTDKPRAKTPKQSSSEKPEAKPRSSSEAKKTEESGVTKSTERTENVHEREDGDDIPVDDIDDKEEAEESAVKTQASKDKTDNTNNDQSLYDEEEKRGTLVRKRRGRKRAAVSSTSQQAAVSKQPQGNELSKIIPGYTAPMKLSATCAAVAKKTSEITLAPPATSSASIACFKMGKPSQRSKKAVDDAGRGWFGMRATPLTTEMKQDLRLIQNRNYLDPKRFYKSSDSVGKFVQAGTVIEGAAEYYSSRLTKKQRRETLVQEVMADPTVATYAQNKYRAMQQEKTEAAQKRRRRSGGRQRFGRGRR